MFAMLGVGVLALLGSVSALLFMFLRDLLDAALFAGYAERYERANRGDSGGGGVSAVLLGGVSGRTRTMRRRWRLSLL